MTQDLHDSINSPSHYLSHPSKIECIEFTIHMDFCIGNAFKYIFRRNFKDNRDRDLLKAHFFLKKSLEHHNEFFEYCNSSMWIMIDKVKEYEEKPYGDILFSLWQANSSPKKRLHLSHAKGLLEEELKKYGLL